VPPSPFPCVFNSASQAWEPTTTGKFTTTAAAQPCSLCMRWCLRSGGIESDPPTNSIHHAWPPRLASSGELVSDLLLWRRAGGRRLEHNHLPGVTRGSCCMSRCQSDMRRDLMWISVLASAHSCSCCYAENSVHAAAFTQAVVHVVRPSGGGIQSWISRLSPPTCCG